MTRELNLTQADYKRFRDLVLERSGLYFPEARERSLRRGLGEALEASSCTGLDEYYRLLQYSPSNSSEWDNLVSALTVGETYFFRNKGHFDALAEHILPELIARWERRNRRIRIWSAGCATGEEPYSIAMLLRELIPRPESWNILILATDINREALRQARQGVYGAWSFRGVEKRIQDRYFGLDGDKRFAISDDVKRMVTFDYLNLVDDQYPSLANNTNSMDVILCRNVTIYFNSEVTQQVVNKFYRCLTNGGRLIVGSAEPNLEFYREFEPENFPGTVVYRKPVAAEAEKEPVFVFEPQKPVEKPPPADPYEEALALLQAGRVDEALTELYEKLDQDPGFVPTYYTLGRVYANKGDLAEAQNWCERAIRKDKLQAEPYLILAMIYQQFGLLEMAVDTLKKTLYLEPTLALAHYNLANIYRLQGNTELARRSYQNVQRLLKDRPSDELIPQGDGLTARRLLQLVKMALASSA
jgi:chemotaxis protein methyltransferase CheR